MIIRIQNVRLIDPYRELEEQRDVYLVDGRLHYSYAAGVDRTLDGTNCLLVPGLVDPHVHFRDPGFPEKEDIESGCRAAARGGFTAVATMPNTMPVCDTPELVTYQIEKAEKLGLCKVLPYSAATIKEQGKALPDYQKMKAAGAVHVSDDGMPIPNAKMMREVMIQAAKAGMLVSDHCEDHSLTLGGAMNEGALSEELGLKGVPAVGEEINVARNILLAQHLDLPVHIAHVSTKTSVEMVRLAKQKGLRVTAEVCPHHISLTDSCLKTKDANFKMYPPLRSEEDRQACVAGLLDGTIDFIATDHAPHTEADKQGPLAATMNGIVGLETSLPVGYKILHIENKLPLMKLFNLYTKAPADFLNLNRKGLLEGEPADCTLIRTDRPYRFDREQMASRSRNTPYHGDEFQAEIILTVYEGKVTYDKA